MMMRLVLLLGLLLIERWRAVVRQGVEGWLLSEVGRAKRRRVGVGGRRQWWAVFIATPLGGRIVETTTSTRPTGRHAMKTQRSVTTTKLVGVGATGPARGMTAMRDNQRILSPGRRGWQRVTRGLRGGGQRRRWRRGRRSKVRWRKIVGIVQGVDGGGRSSRRMIDARVIVPRARLPGFGTRPGGRAVRRGGTMVRARRARRVGTGTDLHGRTTTTFFVRRLGLLGNNESRSSRSSSRRGGGRRRERGGEGLISSGGGGGGGSGIGSGGRAQRRTFGARRRRPGLGASDGAAGITRVTGAVRRIMILGLIPRWRLTMMVNLNGRFFQAQPVGDLAGFGQDNVGVLVVFLAESSQRDFARHGRMFFYQSVTGSICCPSLPVCPCLEKSAASED